MGSVVTLTAAMVATEFMDVGTSTLMKAAMSQGMSQFVYMFYSNAFAGFCILVPSSFIFYRKGPPPKLKAHIIVRILILSILSCSIQILLNTGIRYSSPTLGTAMSDLTPAFTFLLAIISRMEMLDFRLKSSQAKSIGTVVSVAGALIVTLYKGQSFTASQTNQLLLLLSSNWILGGFLCAVGSFFLALLYIVQTWILKDYPEELMVTSIGCIFVTVLSAIVSLIVERDPNAWILKPDVELIAILCSAVFAVSFRNLVHAWACHNKGPLYTAMFKPLGMVIATFLGVSFLGDTLYAGSVIGGIIIAVGFYTVIWGKAQEEKMGESEEGEGNSNLSQALIKSLF